ncbi:hypothetical protein RRG08_060164 [Elysia crispata]|uniref:Uncharacterized protein n=1 Tax=Elysia crispata TaxID=231223 RepID=A0AAE0ZZR0_9GAST|nr:hypothetical protein RRG08_060164 [Elysia crispata]
MVDTSGSELTEPFREPGGGPVDFHTSPRQLFGACGLTVSPKIRWRDIGELLESHPVMEEKKIVSQLARELHEGAPRHARV